MNTMNTIAEERNSENYKTVDKTLFVTYDFESETDSCLVLCIEERNANNYKKVDTRLFVTYDFESETYILYGKRLGILSTTKTMFVPFFFRMDTISAAYEFIKFIISKKSVCSYTLYNYNNMPVNCDTVDYYLMENNMHVNYEVTAYDEVRIKRKELSTILHMLYSVYNYY